MNDDTLQKVLEIGIAFSKEKDKESLLERILTAAMDMTHCDGGTLYINTGETLEFKIMMTKSEGIYQGGTKGEPITMPPVRLSPKNVCACGVLYRRLINIPDVYESTYYDFSGPMKYDAITGYKTTSMMVVPMEDDKENVIGVMQLINALDENGEVIPFRKEYERILSSMGSQAAICLVNINYSHQVQNMLNSLVKVMSTAIDARTPYNANHTKNMVTYAMNFIEWLNRQEYEWKFDEEERHIFILSVWLHDIGKLVTPLEIMDKQDRLGANWAKIENRLVKIRLLAKIERLQGVISEKEEEDRIQQIETVRAFVDQVNHTGILTEDLLQRIRELEGLNYREEDGSVQSWFTDEEMEQLQIFKGTLTKGERKIMQEHVVMTRRMLDQMNFGDDYKNVLVWTLQHHEMLNGTGYPYGLTEAELGPEVRLLTILDIFEALTARDRPYKAPMPVEKALKILREMAQRGELDHEILELFVQSQAWDIEPENDSYTQSSTKKCNKI